MAALYAQEAVDNMDHKSFDIIETKADGESGSFSALVSVFNNVDSVGDRIQPGAFSKTLERWRASGDPVPVILSHQWENPMSHIGVVTDAAETDQGLLVKAQLDMDNPTAAQVHRLMARRSLKEFSFGYTVPKGGQKRGKDGVNELVEVDLIEVGPTLKGANPATELLAVKSALDETDPVAPGVPDEADAQREADELRLELATKDLPAGEPDPEGPDPVVELAGRVSELAQVVETLEKRLQEAEADKQPPEAGSVDPLEKRSQEVALEVVSGGLSLRESPPVKAVPRAEPKLELRELEERCRDEMLSLLSGVQIEDT